MITQQFHANGLPTQAESKNQTALACALHALLDRDDGTLWELSKRSERKQTHRAEQSLPKMLKILRISKQQKHVAGP